MNKPTLTREELKTCRKLLQAAAVEGDLYFKNGDLYDENGVFVCSMEEANKAIDVAVTRVDER